MTADLRLSRSTIWKGFKRNLAAKWFGAPEHRSFLPPWDAEQVLRYLDQFDGRHVRVSSFSTTIACHAPSYRLPASRAERLAKLAELDRATLLEAFPESSTPTSLCFRRYCTAFGEDVVYEAGRGQAMPVFESEQGRHSMASRTRFNLGAFETTLIDVPACTTRASDLAVELGVLMERHDQSLQSKCTGIARRTGIEWMSLEGYFDPRAPTTVTIVDMDLPMDYAFMPG